MSQCAKGANKMWPFFGGFVVPKGQEALFIAVPDTYILLEAKMAKLSFNRRRAGYLVSNAAGGRWPVPVAARITSKLAAAFIADLRHLE
jgi:hypothetical protein